jgi:hypothetical protein
MWQTNDIPHYPRFGLHCRRRHCRNSDNQQWSLFTVGWNPKPAVIGRSTQPIIEGRLKPAVMSAITAGSCQKPAVAHRQHITIGFWLDLAVVYCYHCRFMSWTVIHWLHKRLQPFSPSSCLCLPSREHTRARVWALPSIVAAALLYEACSWILKSGLIFLL